jgi:hypothetical protein
MDYTSLAFGLFALLFGFYTAYLRVANKLGDSEKLKQMKLRFGSGTGNFLHLVFYTLLPIIGGAIVTFYVLILS